MGAVGAGPGVGAVAGAVVDTPEVVTAGAVGRVVAGMVAAEVFGAVI